MGQMNRSTGAAARFWVQRLRFLGAGEGSDDPDALLIDGLNVQILVCQDHIAVAACGP